ncbi:MAG: hypothetical protein ABWX69_01035 [Arthrobacter sp.]
MSGKETKRSSDGGAGADSNSQAKQGEGKGFKSRLTDAQKEMLASKSRGGAASQSVAHSHKPTHVSGKQGPTEKKVRW